MVETLVEYQVYSHDYKAGKAWIAVATEHFGNSGNFVKPVETIKEGYQTTKFYKLGDGKYLCGTVGSKKFPVKIYLEIKDGKIIKEERHQ